MRVKILSILLSVLFLSLSISAQIIERGFGYSSLVHFRRSGKDLNHDRFADFSYGKVFSEKAYDSDAGKIKEIYSFPQESEIQGAYLISNKDLNGDGLDETIVVYNWGDDVDGDGFYDGSKLIAYNGIDGKQLFSMTKNTIANHPIKCLQLLTGDFNGDGKNEVASIYQTYNANGNSGFEIIILNRNGEKFYQKDFIPVTDSSDINYLNSTIGDFNADQIDDLIISYSEFEGGNSNVVTPKIKLLNPNNNSEAGSFAANNIHNCKILLSADLNKDGVDEIIAEGTNNTLDSTRLVIFDSFGTPLFEYTTSLPIDYVFADDFYDDYSPELIFIENPSNEDTLTYFRVYRLSSLTAVPELIWGYNKDAGSKIKLAVTNDFNNNNKKDLAFVEQSSNTEKIKIIDFTGNMLYSISDSVSNVFYLNSGDFNGNGKNDIVFAQHWGIDVNGDGIGDNSYMKVVDTGIGSTLFSYHPFDEGSGGYGGFLFSVLNNGISDKELLRKINYSSSDESLSDIYSYFVKGDFETATDLLFNFYDNETDFIPFEDREYYVLNNEDLLEKYIDKFSVFSGREEPAINSWNNYFRAVATIAIRMKRITSSFWYRIRQNRNNFEKQTFLKALKSIYAHLIFCSREDQFTYGTNHGALFELEGYVPAAVSLNIFKDYNSELNQGWLNVLDYRLRVQMDHVLADGVHDEHSLYYAFRVNLSFNRIANFHVENSSFFPMQNATFNELLDKINSQCTYLMYAVKPVPIITDPNYVFTQTDIPCIGDTKGVWGTNLYGKQFRQNNSLSFLIYPDYYYNGWMFNDSTVSSNLNYSAFGLIDFPNPYTAPSQVSKMFKTSGIFISRSNWRNNEGDFDSLARYCYFKGGEMIPTPGPYAGYSTTSLHGHADLETVEISGYGKNLIQELGGYVNPSDTQVTNNLPESYFLNLYGYSSEMDNFNTARHYFKGTPAHNTVYVNDEDQAEYLGHYSWGGISKLSKNVSEYSINEELDYYLSGYKKEGSHIHNREMFYVKPKISTKISNDYWIFFDQISFQENKENKSEQIWNIAPLESYGILDSKTGIYKSDNFVIVPLLDADNTRITNDLIDTYNLTDLKLIRTKTLKYSKFILGGNSKFCTLIFPFLDKNEYSNFSITKLSVSNDVSFSSETNAALAFKFSFNRGADVYNDFILISNRSNESFPFEGYDQKIKSSDKFTMYRYKNGILLKEIHLLWNNININYDNSGDNSFTLFQNFPNPFSTYTNIQFALRTPAHVSIAIYDVLGRQVKKIEDKFLDAGKYSYKWNGTNDFNNEVSSGVYLYRLDVNGKFVTKKIMRVK
jgi:hypothetical protein